MIPRRLVNHGFHAGTWVALFLVVGPALWVLASLVVRVIPHWHWDVLWRTTAGSGGGLAQALVGTLMLMLGVLILAGTVGVLAGIHLAELAAPGKGWVLRTAVDVLSGFPSIVLGYVGYVALVVGLHWGFSLLPAVVILSIMVVPYITRATESALRQVPTGYREGADALGMSMGHGLRTVVLRASLPGIVTGLLIALAIAVGETAPLLYTARWTDALPGLALTHSNGFPYLTYLVYSFWDYPNAAAHALAQDAALVLVVLVLLLLVSARVIVARSQRHAEIAGRQGR